MTFWERVVLVAAVVWLVTMSAVNDPFSYQRDEWLLAGLLPFVVAVGLIWIHRAWNERSTSVKLAVPTEAVGINDEPATTTTTRGNPRWSLIRWALAIFVGTALLGTTANVMQGLTTTNLSFQMSFAAGLFAALSGIKPKHNKVLTILVGIVWFVAGFIVWGFAVFLIK